jgi:hypothetical protein
MKNDSETLNVDKAMDHEANFTKIFGERKPLTDEFSG